MTRKCKTQKKGRKIFSAIVTLILTSIMLIVIVACCSLFIEVLKGNSPSVFGYRLYYILTDSMTPELQENDVILSKVTNTKQEAMNIKEGDVVTYIAKEGPQKGLTITHRVEKGPYLDEEKHQFFIITKGTKIGAISDPPVPIANVQGVMVKKIAFIGKVYNYIISGYGTVIILILPMAIIVVLLVVKLISIIRNKALQEDNSSSIAEIKRKAIAEYKLKEKCKAEIAQRAIEEYKRKYEKDK